jgi:ABC-type sugar transport system ATPase subunit
MAEVTLTNVRKTYAGGVVAVKDFNLNIADHEFVVLVGPSGCGKSTTLRMVAGLEDITGGTIAIGNRVVNALQPKDRDIAMVFQNYALYQHMSVYDNLAFGLRNRRVQESDIDAAVRGAAKVLSIEPLLDRRPKQLSGGQQQRVALVASCATPRCSSSTSHCPISTPSCAPRCVSRSRNCACGCRPRPCS